jgi:ABC-type polysaccharide/polyol phosphate transport system ATPase subunit
MSFSIRAENLSKTFRLPKERRGTLLDRIRKLHIRNELNEKKTLDNVSFEIKKGEFFGIIGRNGSGKSTLLKILAGIYKPDRGSKVEIVGQIAPMLELGVGFNPELTGRENVFLSGTILGLTKKQIQNNYDRIVEFAELKDFMGLQVKHYSSGMAVRLAFSVAVQVDAPIMLLDEVLAVGDFAFQEKCFALFEDYKRQGKTIVLVAHSSDAMKRFADRVMWIHQAKVRAIGNPEDVIAEYHSIKA